jgi:hypothetical protein
MRVRARARIISLEGGCGMEPHIACTPYLELRGA